MSHLDVDSSPPTMANSTRSSFTYLERAVSPQSEKTKASSTPAPENTLKELTSRGEEEIERYGGDDPRDPPLKSPGAVSVAVPALPTEDPNRVTWDGPDDPTNPQNWSRGYKWFLTLVCIIMTVNVYVTFCYHIRAPTRF